MNQLKPLFVAATLTLAACSGAPQEVDTQVGTSLQPMLTPAAGIVAPGEVDTQVETSLHPMLIPAACTVATGQAGTLHQGVLICNALLPDALENNALTGDQLASNALTSNALTSESLTVNHLPNDALHDPVARVVLSYVVSCALPASAHLQVPVGSSTFTFDGQLGLAPEWGKPEGHCDEQCHEWVSACVLGRTNHLGQSELISERGQNDGLDTVPGERHAYTSREATYYGDIFAAPKVFDACLPPGQSEIPRVCGPSIQGCFLNVVGPCEEVCEHPSPDGAYRNCKDHLPLARGHHGDNGRGGDGDGDGDGDDFPAGTKTYHGSVTVFLQP
jgi:hypothetical protein